MDGTVHIAYLSQKPCVVHHLDHYNKFIVGTYELFPSIKDARTRLNSHLDEQQLKKALERINFRAGKLILFGGQDVSTPSIEYEFDCHAGGGVFDLKVRYNNLDASYSIYVAHSNGTVGIYKLSQHCGDKICLREHINVNGSKMLTSIDIIPECGFAKTDYRNASGDDNGGSYNNSNNSNDGLTNSLSSASSANLPPPPVNNQSVRIGSPTTPSSRLVVGDSDGFVTVINQREPIRGDVAQGDSIWQVKSLKLASGKIIIIVGAENCSWFIYGLNEQDRSLNLLYKNAYKDFGAGITSICILDVIHSAEYDFVEILFGSYDETIQTYHIKIKQDGLSKPDVCHKNTISIDGGGIWRVKPLKEVRKRQLCIAAMYAGSFTLSLANSGERRPSDQQRSSLQRLEDVKLCRLLDTNSLKLSHKPLHYDIDVSACNSTYCVVDFNNSLCLFKTIDR